MSHCVAQLLKTCRWVVPDTPVVETSPSKARGVGSIPGHGVKIVCMPRAKKKPKTQSRNNTVTNSIKTFFKFP